jgi:hypothetical protein
VVRPRNTVLAEVDLLAESQTAFLGMPPCEAGPNADQISPARPVGSSALFTGGWLRTNRVLEVSRQLPGRLSKNLLRVPEDQI